MQGNTKIYVAGHRGLVGSAMVRALVAKGCRNVLQRTSAEQDLTYLEAVRQFFEQERPDSVFLAVAKVGGILTNNNYGLAGSHVIPAMIRKFHEARVSDAPHVTLWGTGLPRQDFSLSFTPWLLRSSTSTKRSSLRLREDKTNHWT
jgi:hypothetical protein